MHHRLLSALLSRGYSKLFLFVLLAHGRDQLAKSFFAKVAGDARVRSNVLSASLGAAVSLVRMGCQSFILLFVLG